jgi:hypothetical protein
MGSCFFDLAGIKYIACISSVPKEVDEDLQDLRMQMTAFLNSGRSAGGFPGD